MSETEFLMREAVAARMAMDGTLRNLAGAPAGKGGWGAWVRKHPAILIGGAAVAGALMARFFSRRRKNDDQKKGHGFIGTILSLGKGVFGNFIKGLVVSRFASTAKQSSDS